MTNYTKLSVNFMTLVITIVLFFLVNNFSIAKKENKSNETLNSITNTQQSVNDNISNSNNNVNNVQNEQPLTIANNVPNDNNTEYEWQIEIPSISLKAPISEGTTKEVMDKYVGHFTETSPQDGNVGLAAHNRGYDINYFENLKTIKKDAQIIYKYKDVKRIYYVDKIKIIKDTDWSYLENTENNVITLITCVENEPEYRRCIQAIERK